MHVITSMCALNHSNHCGLYTEEPTATRENERSSVRLHWIWTVLMVLVNYV